MLMPYAQVSPRGSLVGEARCAKSRGPAFRAWMREGPPDARVDGSEFLVYEDTKIKLHFSHFKARAALGPHAKACRATTRALATPLAHPARPPAAALSVSRAGLIISLPRALAHFSLNQPNLLARATSSSTTRARRASASSHTSARRSRRVQARRRARAWRRTRTRESCSQL
jgi:hypothetical protein